MLWCQFVPAQDGRVVAWGWYGENQTNVPAGLSNVVSVAGGRSHSLVLLSNGRTVAWGNTYFPQSTAPPGLSNVAAIGKGYVSSVAVRSNGTVFVWGEETGNTNVPADITNAIAAEAGYGRATALLSDGRVRDWGLLYNTVPAPEWARSNIISIASTTYETAALRADGRVLVWGGNSPVTNVPPGLSNVVAISAGGTHMLALRADGTVTAWGTLYAPTGTTAAFVPAGLSNVIQVASGDTICAGLRRDGTVVAWGFDPDAIAVPAGLSNVVYIGSGAHHTLALLAGGPFYLPQRMPDRTGYRGGTSIFRVQPVGAAPFSYEWRFNDVVMPGETNSVLVVTNLQLTNSGTYTVTIHSARDEVLTDEARLDVVPFWISRDPESRVQYIGGTTGFRVEAFGSGLQYQWRCNGTNLPGATASSLTLTNLALEQAGFYSVMVSNALAAQPSAEARLDVVHVAAWGDNSSGQVNLVPGLTNVAAIGAGLYHSVALRQDGSVVAWGQDTQGSTSVPTGLPDVIGIAAGAYHNLALLSNGTVRAWGKSDYAQTNVPANVSNVVAIAAGGDNSIALRRDGTVTSWGGRYFQTPATANNIVDIATAWDHCLALRADGKILAWGDAYYTPNAPESLGNVVGIAAGPGFDLALRANGKIVAWGSGTYGGTNVPPGLSNATAVSAGSLALDGSGRVTWWGNTNAPQIPPADLLPMVAIASGQSHSLGLVGSGPPRFIRQMPHRTVYGGANAYFRTEVTGERPLSYRWRRGGVDITGATNSWLALTNSQFSHQALYSVVVSNRFGVVESDAARLNVIPLFITAQPTNQVCFAGGTAMLTAGIEGNGPFAYQWLFNGVPLLDATNAVLMLQNTQPEQAGYYSLVISNAFGAVTSAVMRLDLPWVAMWGRYSNGYQPLPDGLTNIVAVEGAPNHSLALRSDGTVVSWGFYSSGASAVPDGLTNVVAIAAGSEHSLALLGDRTVTGWGRADQGALSPWPDATNLVSISAGGSHSVGLRADGQAFAWGYGYYGEANFPVTLSNAVAVRAGFDHNLGIRADGTVFGWGRNLNGECSPPAGLTNVAAVAPGGYFSLALRDNGTVAGWGANDYGQTTIPVGLSNVVAIAAGAGHSMALRADGSLVSWGRNDYSQSTVPQGVTNVATVSSGASLNTLALASAGPAFLRNRLADRTLVASQNAYFYAEASGARPLRYQWRLNGTNLPGATNAILTLPNILPPQAGMYSVALSNRYGATVSDVGGLSILPLEIQSQPADQIQYAGGSIAFSVTVRGPNPVNYQWRRDGTNIPGQTSATLMLTNLQLNQSGFYSVSVSNSWGGTISYAARLRVEPLLISAQPQSVTARSGSNPTLSVAVQGVGPFTYQWWHNGVALAGATGSTLLLSNAQSAQSGSYAVVISNGYGAVTSQAVPVNIQLVASWGLYGSFFNGETNIVALAAGNAHMLGLRRDGSVVAYFNYGNNYGQTNVPADLTDAVAVACGSDHSLALRSNGTVVAWGRNNCGQTNVPAGLSNVVAVAGGALHSLALRADGTVIGWGVNTYGQTNIARWGSNIVAIAGSYNETVALQADGRVIGDSRYYGADFEITNAAAVDAGYYFKMALQTDGRVIEWDSSQITSNVPPGLDKVIAINAGEYHRLAVREDRTVVAWGTWASEATNVPAGLSNVASVAGGNGFSLALLADGAPYFQTPLVSRTALAGDQTIFYAVASGARPLSYQWRCNGTNLPGATNDMLVLTNIQPGQDGLYSVVASNFLGTAVTPEARVTVTPSLIFAPPRNVSVWRGGAASFSVDFASTEPLSFQWNRDGVPLPGATAATLTLTNVQIAQGGDYTLTLSNRYGSITSAAGVLDVGVVSVWGANGSGQTNLPGGLRDVRSVSAMGDFCAALKADGRVTLWGTTDATMTNTAAALTNISDIACGWHHVVALNENGTVVALGYNAYGEAVVPGGLSGVLAIAASPVESVALRTNGTVVAWGNRTYVPPELSNVMALAASGSDIVTLKADGHLFGLGSSSVITNMPPWLSNIVAIAAGNSHCVALREDGTVVAWGSNDSGETDVPPGLANVVSIGAGGRHSMAVLENGTMVAWGRNTNGQTSIPVGVSTVAATTGGYDHTMALLDDGKPLLRNAFIDRSVLGGEETYFYAQVSGSLPLQFQWQFYGTNLPGATSRVLHLTNIAISQVGPYSVRISNAQGETTSPEAWLTAAAFRITSQPANRTHYAGGSTTFSVGVEGNGPFSYQWQFAGTNLAGATDSSLTLTNLQFADAGLYSVLVSNPWGTLPSSDAQLTVLPFIITMQPQSRTGYVGVATSLSVGVSGTGVQLQWRFNGEDLPGETNSTLLFPDAQLTQSGSYAVLVSSVYGSGLSGPANLAINLVTAWGSAYSYPPGAPIQMPRDVTNVVAIAAGEGHALAVRSDGGVTAWGTNNFGQTNVPAGLSNVVAVAAGASHSVALRNDGKVFAWGRNIYNVTNVPPSLTNVVGVACGANHNLALRGDGTVVSWGDNTYGQTNVPAGLTNVVGISAGERHSLAVRGNGTVVAWEQNTSGFTNIAASLTNIVAVAAGYTHSLALRASGRAVGWGTLMYGPVDPPATISNLVAIGCGGTASLGLRSDGTLVAWGGSYMQPVIPAGLSNVTAIASSRSYNLALGGNGPPFVMTSMPDRMAGALDRIYFQALASGRRPSSGQWGLNGTNIPGATNVSLVLPKALPADTGLYTYSASNALGVAVSRGGRLVVGEVAGWGSYSANTGSVSAVSPPGITNVIALCTGGRHGLALRADSTVAGWGENTYGQISIPTFAQGRCVALAAGADYSLALTTNGTLMSWGLNSSGQRNIPSGLSNVVGVAAGSSHSVALRADGKVVSWGSGSLGETNQPADLNRVGAIACGSRHTLALLQDGTVRSWGNGAGTNVPAQLANVVMVAGGGQHSLALRGDGSVIAWGTGGGTNVPAGLSNVVAITAGDEYGCALQANGKIVAWGSQNSAGPTNVPSMSGAVAVSSSPSSRQVYALLGQGRPFIGCQPFASITTPGGRAQLTSLAVGQDLFYQWQFNGSDLPGATNRTLNLAGTARTGTYRLVVSNAFGTTISSVSQVTSIPIFELGSGTFAAPDGFHLRVVGLSGFLPVVLYSSSDLLQWEPIHTNHPVIGTFAFVDSLATNQPRQFYRVAETDFGPLRLTVHLNGNRPDGVNVLGIPGQGTVTLLCSSNLVDWAVLATNSTAVGQWLYLDPSLPVAPGRFYRAENR